MTNQHGGDSTRQRARGEDYERLLEQFNAEAKKPSECVEHLVSLGYGRSQARNAVYRYRLRHGLTTSKS